MAEAYRQGFPHDGQNAPIKIQRFRFGEIVIDGTLYTEDVIVFEDRVIPHWWRKEGHLLQLEDLKGALDTNPEALIVGTGTQGALKIASEVVAYTRKIGVELLQFHTRGACQSFNHLRKKRRVVAVLHLTC